MPARTGAAGPPPIPGCRESFPCAPPAPSLTFRWVLGAGPHPAVPPAAPTRLFSASPGGADEGVMLPKSGVHPRETPELQRCDRFCPAERQRRGAAFPLRWGRERIERRWETALKTSLSGSRQNAFSGPKSVRSVGRGGSDRRCPAVRLLRLRAAAG